MPRQASPFLETLTAIALLLSVLSPFCCAQSPSNIECSVQSGLDGTWKIGFSTRHVITLRSSSSVSGQIAIQTVDGDGVPVVYRDANWTYSLDGKNPVAIEVTAKHGRGDRPIRVLVTDASRKLVVDHALTDAERGTAIPAEQPWVVGIGRDLKLTQGAMKSVGNNFGEFSVSELKSPDAIPLLMDAFEGVNVIVFSSSESTINREISEPQRQAIVGWVKHGGQMILTWGEHTMELTPYPELMAMLPGQIVGVAKECEPGPIESLLGSQQQLQPLSCALLRLSSGRVDVGTLTSNRTKLPIVARWAHGMGSVLWLATEIDSPQMMAWETRTALVKYLLKDMWEKNDTKPTKQVFQSYEELTGQLNATLDTFARLQLANLSQLVVIAGLLALLLGPFDYFVVSRWLKRPRWTWWTLWLGSLSAMVITIALARTWKPAEPSINGVELIDINDETSTLFGRSFIHCYAGRRGLYDIQAHHRTLNLQPAEGAKPQPNRVNWFGQPGKGLGGFDSNVSTQLGLPTYSIQSNSSQASDFAGLGFPAAGTKALMSTWSESIDIAPGSNALTTVLGKDDLLQGSFTNPLGVDLLDATLYFAGRAYAIPARIRPGERIPISTAVPKDIMRRLQRRAFVAGEEHGIEWDPNDTDNVDRLGELLSFHRAAGASAYTGLSNRYLSNLECSDLLKLERAVVFGYVAEPVTTWTLRRDQIPVQALGGRQRTMVRMTLRVQNNNPSTSPTREYSIPNP